MTKALQEALIHFLEHHPIKRLSKNLRRILMEHLMQNEAGQSIYLHETLIDLHGLFELLDVAEDADRHQYIFRYDDDYFINPARSAISLSMPKTQQEYRSHFLFPFFYGLLSEGVNRQTQCRLLRIDEKDHFSLLLATAQSDTIGSITVKEITS